MREWEQFLEVVTKDFGQETVQRWLTSLTVVSFDACNLYLEAKDSFQQLWFDEHIRPKLHQFVNGNKKPIKVHVDWPGKKLDPKKQKSKQPPALYQLTFDELDPSCLFEEFIQTEDNQMGYLIAHETTSKLVENKLQALSTFSEQKNSSPIQDFVNPIVLYGPTGSGKTHLLQAICHKLKRVGYNALYTRAETFTEHVVKAIRVGNMAPFRDIYRTVDALLVDDVQYFAKKNATQEEFFHTFNALHTAGKLIVLSLNSAPQMLQGIEPRLISRFEWGLLLTLATCQKKDLVSLIERKAQSYRYPLSTRTAQFLAETFPLSPKSSIRALETLMLRSHMHQKGKKALVPLAEAKELLHDLIQKEKSNQISATDIIARVAEHFGMPSDDITGKSQNGESVKPRQLAMYLCRELLKIPYMAIGDTFKRDHSTVMSSIRVVQKELSIPDSSLTASYNSLYYALTCAQKSSL
jgi:chromosomal replication initiator protein